MAESGTDASQKNEDKGRGGCESLQEPQSLSPATNLGTKRHLPRGIVIQLTGTEGEWDSLDDNELIFSLDNDEDNPWSPLPKQRQLSDDEDRESQSFHVPLSPSSPSSLGNCSAAGPSFLSPGPSSPTHRPLASLVKSLSTELEPKEGSSLRPRPFLSLVKSISTEISRSEPEVSQSKSDSRLNLHLWKQLTQQKTRSNGDSRTAPPSPSSLSPSGEGLKGGFFKMELEDTKRKLSEAVHEPLSSMFSKIMREEAGGSPKHQHRMQAGCRGLGRDGSTDTTLSDSPVRSVRKTDADAPPVFDWPSVRHPGRVHCLPCPVHHHRPPRRDEDLEVCTDGDVMQVFAAETRRRTRGSPGPPAQPAPLAKAPPTPRPPHPLPRTSLFCVAVLSYGYFILPLSSYLSGLALGLALGFLLGLLLIRMGSSRASSSDPTRRPTPTLLGEGVLTGGGDKTQPDVLKGWMNEIRDYDPETCHPASTHSVYATLEGCSLRLDTPRANISRRAAYDERVHEAAFVKSRSFQLAGSKVFLLPPVLARKRVWNPKYPICIQLAQSQEAEGNRAEEPSAGQDRQTPQPPYVLHLFGRTGREKEEWFHHLSSASAEKEKETDRGKPGRCTSRLGDLEQRPSVQVGVGGSGGSSRGSSRVGSSDDDVPSTPGAPSAAPFSSAKGLSVLDYPSYMARLLAGDEATPLSSPGASSTEPSPTIRGNCTCDAAELPGTSHTSWINALIGRIFWDFLREQYWADAVSHKIQKKLSKIRVRANSIEVTESREGERRTRFVLQLPYFMNELTLTDLDMGCCMPQITATSRPEVNHRGLWLQLQLVYTGNLQMTLQTKFNLSRLGKESGPDTVRCMTDRGSLRCRPVLSVLADSDEESSSAASSDEEDLLLSEAQAPVGEKGSSPAPEGTAGGKTGRKILRFVDKIAKSKYFQKAAENEFIKKKFEEMSNTPLLLTVEVQELSGTLVINIPAPPTDRIWYSFCVPPKLDLHVRPKLGEREVTFCHVTEWIEKKLQDEFQKVFVLPNMDDVYLPLMHSAADGPPAGESRRSHSSSTESIERIPPESCAAESD